MKMTGITVTNSNGHNAILLLCGEVECVGVCDKFVEDKMAVLLLLLDFVGMVKFSLQ